MDKEVRKKDTHLRCAITVELTENANYLPIGFVDCENDAGDIIPGDWRKVMKMHKAYSICQVLVEIGIASVQMKCVRTI